MTASIETLLPEPLSPTTQSTSPSATRRSTPSTAWNGRRQSRTRPRSCDVERGRSSAQLRVERVAQAVAEQVEGHHGDQDGEAGEGRAATRRAGRIAARRPAWCPIPAWAAGRRGRGSRARRRRGWRRRSRASPARSAAPGSSAAPRSSISRSVPAPALRGGDDVFARELAQGGGARQADVAGQQDDGDGEHGVGQARARGSPRRRSPAAGSGTPAARPSAA